MFKSKGESFFFLLTVLYANKYKFKKISVIAKYYGLYSPKSFSPARDEHFQLR